MESKYVALTFDDGPNTETTPKVLDLLEKYQVKGTFFLVGSKIDDSTKDLIKRGMSLGCEYGNHSKTHSFMTKLSTDEIVEEYEFTSAKIEEVTGYRPRFFRPPYLNMDDRMLDVIDATFIFGASANDWEPEVLAEERVNRWLKNTQNGVLYLMHDFEGNIETIKALDKLIPQLKKDGYEMVTLSELFALNKITREVGMNYEKFARPNFNGIKEDVVAVESSNRKAYTSVFQPDKLLWL